MALVGVLSTGLLHEEMVRKPPSRGPAVPLRTLVDRAPDGRQDRTLLDGKDGVRVR